MGNEAVCAVAFGGQRGEAKVLLETDEMIVRSPFRLKVPFAEMSDVAADDQRLKITWRAKTLSVALGRDAKKWAEKIRNPKSVIDKLGIKPRQRISVIGLFDEQFIEGLHACGADVSRRTRRESDIIFVAAEHRKQLDRLVGIRDSLSRDGALWVVRPKGSDAITESEIMAAGKAGGFVDVKVVRFSPAHTAEKFVFRLRDRG